MLEDSRISIIAEYLEDNFSESKVIRETDLVNEIQFSILTNEETYHLKISKGFIETRDEALIKADLEAFGTASVLRQLEGFSVLLSNSGCIFDS